jgi:transcription elongation factor Elf1
MAMVENVIEKQIGDEFHTCETCGYERGFHVSFERREARCETVLICPNCGQRYRVGWKVILNEGA